VFVVRISCRSRLYSQDETVNNGADEVFSELRNDRWLLRMEMKKISSGRLRAIGYDAGARRLRVQLDDGTTLEYTGVGQEIWRRLSTSSSAWSVYRDNVEEEFDARRVATTDSAAGTKNNPLDDLFG
jgi:hypothetical protein